MTASPEVRAIVDNAVLGVESWRVWPGMEVHGDEQLVWTSSQIPFPLFNGVLRTRAPEAAIEARIRDLVVGASRREVPLAWWVTPDSTPSDLRARLEDHGFLHADSTTGMAADLARVPFATNSAPPDGTRVIEVTNRADLERWCSVMAPVYGFTDDARRPWLDLLDVVGYGPGRPWRHFLGLLDGKPVATSSLFAGAGVGGLSNVATITGARRRGAGAAVTLAALDAARSLELTRATLCATDMAIPLYARLGFRALCETHVYLWPVE